MSEQWKLVAEDLTEGQVASYIGRREGDGREYQAVHRDDAPGGCGLFDIFARHLRDDGTERSDD